MRDKAADAAQMAIKRNDFIEKGFELFSQQTIESVTLQDVAEACGYGMATIYRYFKVKPVFVVEVATRKWEQFREENQERRPSVDFEGMTAAQIFEFYLDSFLLLYKDHKDLLRFNQLFNMYAQSDKIDQATMKPYQKIICGMREQFGAMYQKALNDHTLRTDVPEEEMFSTTLHLMLAAVTRYAVGLVYIPDNGFDPVRELTLLKEMLLARYCTGES